MRRSAFMAVVFGGILSTTTAFHANATTVDVVYEFPSQGTVAQDLGVQSLPASYSIFNNVEVTVTDNQISVGPGPNCTSFCRYLLASFNGFEIDYTGMTITSATLDSLSSLPDFTQSDISNTNNSIFLNFQGLTQAPGQVALVDVNTVAATPLPSTWSLLLTALAGLGFLGYRRGKTGELSTAA
jgi:hypothetical protein